MFLLSFTHSFPLISELGCCSHEGGSTSDPHKLEQCLEQRRHTMWSEWMKTSLTLASLLTEDK